MKRSIIVLITAIALTGCGKVQDKAGGGLIRDARAEYKGLDSARVVMTNLDTGEEEQSFTFKYDEKDTLVFSYYGKSENSEYAQYNNGAECFTYDNGEYSYVSKGEKDFVRYTREMTHPQADEGLLIYSPENITEAWESDENGIEHVHHVYDVDKIGASVENGQVTEFWTDYYFKDGELLYFVETTGAEDEGKELSYSYKIEITEKNSVKKVENTAKQFQPEQ
ncbi:MAG: hypothetical protein IJ806_02730 [Ruminococcus sp.]|nr:hypothetical protein [Ruminococcus sp.]